MPDIELEVLFTALSVSPTPGVACCQAILIIAMPTREVAPTLAAGSTSWRKMIMKIIFHLFLNPDRSATQRPAKLSTGGARASWRTDADLRR